MTVVTLKICINILMFVSVIAMENDEKVITQDETSLARALRTIISEFYVTQSNTILITKGISNRLDGNSVVILSDICANIGKTLAVALQINEVGIRYQCYGKFINNIILVYSYESFRLTYDSMTAETFDYSGYYTIVVTAEFNQTDVGIVKNILQDCWQRHITNVNVLLSQRSESSEATLYTYFPFTPVYCETVIVPVIWNYFHVDHFVHAEKEMFPPKTRNLYQCPLTVVTVEIQPYIFLGGIQSNNQIVDVEGIDANLIYVLSERMNFKPTFVLPDDIPRRGVIHRNGTVTGAFGMVFRRKANITTAAILYNAHRESILTASKAYMYEQLVFVVPNPIPYSPLEILLFPFTLSTWVAIVLILALAVVVILIVTHNNVVIYGLAVGLENPSPYMNLVCTLLVGLTQNEPKKNFARFLVIMWILACFVLRTAYQGQLFTFMKMGKMKDNVRSIEELIVKNISVKLPEELSAFVTFDKRMEKLLQFHHPNSYWNYVTETEAYVYPMSPLIYNVTRMIYTKGSHTKLKTLRIGIFPFVMYLPKYSCLTNEIDERIQNIVESGLIEKWTSEYKETRFSVLDSGKNTVSQTLNIAQLIGVFQLCGLILVVALISFILEIVSTINVGGRL